METPYNFPLIEADAFEMFMAKAVGKQIIQEDSGWRITGYYYKGGLYISNIKELGPHANPVTR